MSPVNHLLTGWLIANTAPNLQMRERSYITLAAVVADIDGLGIIAEILTRHSQVPLLWWSQYHHVLAHNLLFGCVLALCVLLISQHRWTVAVLVFVSFHIHLIEDILSGRDSSGHAWGIQYLYPFSDQEWLWQGQWQLNAWPNILVGLMLIVLTLYLAWKRSYSPIAMFSQKADQHVIDALHQRFGKSL